ncbi:hypothetical protein NEUTE2DRAFT_73563 [Neurospora tetrasperma FGSC 2509]|nr:hypothetical protein NEUTE2DRAFT_73563 [Neurospora tetrasperma FGSC 2509]
MAVCLTALGIRDPDKLRKPQEHINEEPDQHFETVSLLNYPGSGTTYLPDFPSRPDEIITTSHIYKSHHMSIRTVYPTPRTGSVLWKIANLNPQEAGPGPIVQHHSITMFIRFKLSTDITTCGTTQRQSKAQPLNSISIHQLPSWRDGH